MQDYNTNVFPNEKTSFNSYLSRVFSTMVVGLLVSFGLAYLIYTNFEYIYLMLGDKLFVVSIVLVVAELAVAIIFSSRLNKMSKAGAWACYIIYSALTGTTLSTVLLTYTRESVLFAFVATAILFACMSIIGHTTKVDLTRFSSILGVGLLVMIIVSLINAIFFNSATINYIMAVVGVFLFLIIIATDIQKLKLLHQNGLFDSEIGDKLVIFGAFELYLDFINLFLRILQIFGRSNNSRQ